MLQERWKSSDTSVYITTLPQYTVSPFPCSILGRIAPRLRINRLRIATELSSGQQIGIREVRSRIGSLGWPHDTRHVQFIGLFLAHVFNSSRVVVCTLIVYSKTTNNDSSTSKTFNDYMKQRPYLHCCASLIWMLFVVFWPATLSDTPELLLLQLPIVSDRYEYREIGISAIFIRSVYRWSDCTDPIN